MAMVSFKKGLLASLPNTYSEGTFYVTTDERAIYLDVSDSARIRLGDFQEFANVTALNANTNPSTSALYYVTDINCLAKWNGSEYIQINRDTGMTSVEVVGEGNAVTAAVYDATGRKLTLTKGATFATREYVGEIPEGYEESNVIAYVNKKAEEVLSQATGGSSESAASVLAALNTYKSENDPKVAQAQADIDALEEKVGDKAVGTQIDEKITALDLENTYDALGAAKAVQGETTGTVKSVEDALATYKESNGEAVAAAKKAGDDAMAEAQKRVASIAAGDNSVTVAGTATAPTVAAKLSQDADNALKLAEDGLKVVIPAAAEYSIAKDETSADFAAVYHLTKDGVNIGAAINIPKDMVVESGSVVTNPEGQAEGTYIKLVLQNVAEPLFINVGSLIEYVTSGSVAGDMIQIVVSDDHKVTASIADGAITLAKLETDVQTAIGKAHTHENKAVLDGITETKVADWDDAVAKEHEHANKELLDTYTQTEANLADAVAKKHEHANAEELAKIADGDKAKWDAAEGNAKTYADGLNTAMDGRVKALEAIDHEAYKGYADQAEADAIDAAKEYADGLAGNYDAAGSATTAESNAKAHTETLLTWGSF